MRLKTTERSREVLRWMAVLPAAFLGSLATRVILAAVLQIVSNSVGVLDGSSILYWLQVFLYYVHRETVFVVAGAMMAPRHRRATSLVLAGVGFCVSLMTHVVGQHLAGNRVGQVNYTHLLAESTGLLAGAAAIFWYESKNRRAAITPVESDLQGRTGGARQLGNFFFDFLHRIR